MSSGSLEVRLWVNEKLEMKSNSPDYSGCFFLPCFHTSQALAGTKCQQFAERKMRHSCVLDSYYFGGFVKRVLNPKVVLKAPQCWKHILLKPSLESCSWHWCFSSLNSCSTYLFCHGDKGFTGRTYISRSFILCQGD